MDKCVVRIVEQEFIFLRNGYGRLTGLKRHVPTKILRRALMNEVVLMVGWSKVEIEGHYYFV